MATRHLKPDTGLQHRQSSGGITGCFLYNRNAQRVCCNTFFFFNQMCSDSFPPVIHCSYMLVQMWSSLFVYGFCAHSCRRAVLCVSWLGFVCSDRVKVSYRGQCSQMFEQVSGPRFFYWICSSKSWRSLPRSPCNSEGSQTTINITSVGNTRL